MKEGHGFCAPKVTTFPGIQKKIITMNLNSPSHHLLFTMNSHWGLCRKTNYHKSDGDVVWSFNFILLQCSTDFEGSDHTRKVIISAVKQISTNECCVALWCNCHNNSRQEESAQNGRTTITTISRVQVLKFEAQNFEGERTLREYGGFHQDLELDVL
jgi:hypothetical protein